MSLDSVRSYVATIKRNELAVCERSRKRKLRELYGYTSFINRRASKDPEVILDSPPSPNETRFLDENDIAKGCHFQEASIPPVEQDAIPSQVVPTPSDVKMALLLSPPSVSLRSPGDAVAANGSNAQHQTPKPEDVASDTTRTKRDAQRSSPDQASPLSESRSAVQSPGATNFTEERNARDEHMVDSMKSLPFTSEEVVTQSNSALSELDTEKAHRPKVVHLSPRHEHEERLRDIERIQDATRRKDKREDERLVLPTNGLSGEAASSPSSTVGAQSTFTPRPGHQSPDTSPDTEAFPGNTTALRSRDRDSLTEEHVVSDNHDRALKSQIGYTRARARSGSPATPDAQLRMEEEQAVKLARESEKTSDPAGAYNEVKGPAEGSSLASKATDLTQHINGAAEVPKAEILSVRPEIADNALLLSDSRNVQTHVSPPPVRNAIGRAVNSDAIVVKPESRPSIEGNVDETPPSFMRTTPVTGAESSLPVDVDMADAPDQAANNNQPSTFKGASTPITTASVASPSERMTTRVASGALRQKSVSEIIGEKSQALLDKSPHLLKKTSTMDSTGSLNSAQGAPVRDRERRQKEKPRASPVATPAEQDSIFNTNSMALMSEEYAALRGASEDSDRDYLEPLFVYQAYTQQPGQTPLQSLLNTANKTLTTANQYAALRESLDHRILRRIYHLQNANRWSFRQMEKCPEPSRPTTSLDHLLGQMKAMRTDFREERRWKTAAARSMAEWCAEWVASTPDRRISLQIKVKLRSTARASDSEDRSILTTDEPTNDPLSTSDLISSAMDIEGKPLPEDDSLHQRVHEGHAPAALFSLGYGDVVLEIDSTPANESLLLELPLYNPSIIDETLSRTTDHQLVPVSKFVTGKLVSTATGPPKKRSRYDYDDEAEPNYSNRVQPSDDTVSSSPSRLSLRVELPPEQSDVALFIPENKHVRDRLHASHAFRPPSEFSMPSTAFFESRMSSQWLWEEDQRLRILVKEFSYNWSLISDFLKLPSWFTSGAERRTPWECFERWVLLEGLPADMSKTQYFRTYQARLEAAQRTIAAQHQAAQQQLQQQVQTPNQALNTPLRRRTSQPIRVERKRNNRYLILIDCMRKLARQRETKAHKQQEAAKANALRKAHEGVQTKPTNIHTPQEFSRIRHEREVKLQERQEAYRQQVLAQQRTAAAMQQAGRLQGQQQPVPGATGQSQRNGTPGSTHGPSPLGNAASQVGHPQAGNNQMRPPSQPQAVQNGLPNGSMQGMPMGLQGIPQAQMQANMQGQARIQPHNSPDNLRMVMQQRAFQASNQQQHQMQQQYNLAAAHLSSANGGMQNPNVLAALAGPKINNSSNSMTGPPGSSASPHMSQQTQSHSNQPQPLSSGHIPAVSHITHQIQAQHPSLSPEQVRQLTNERLKGQVYQQQRQSALNAAAGASAAGPMTTMNPSAYQPPGSVAGSASPQQQQQQYQHQLHQRMLQQQRAQQSGSPTGLNAARPPSRSATPMQGPPQHHQRSGSGTAQDSQSPRPPPAQLARGQ